MKLNKVSILYFSLEIITRLISYFFSYVLYLPILRIIPSTILIILSIYPNINFRRALNSVLPFAIFSTLYQIIDILIYGNAVISIYKSILFFIQYFGVILVFEVIDKNYSDKWKNTIPNLALIMLFIQTLGFLISPTLPKYQLFSTNIIAFGNLVIFNKFFPGSGNKLNIFDFLKAILSLYLMSIVRSRACFFISILILITALSLRLMKLITKSDKINFYYKKIIDNKLRNLLLFISFLIIPYYLIFNTFASNFIGETDDLYNFINKTQGCQFYYKNEIKIEGDLTCDFLEEQIFYLSDPSALIRTFSDVNAVNEILKNPLKLLIPIKNKVDESYIGLRNYINRSHNFVLTNINETGIFGILFVLFTVSKYDKIMRNKNLQLNFISPYFLFLVIFSSDNIFPLFPLLLYTRRSPYKTEDNL